MSDNFMKGVFVPPNKSQIRIGPGIYRDDDTAGIRSVRGGGIAFSNLHGRYTEQSLRGNIFTVTQPSAVALTGSGVNGSFGLWNPFLSNVLVFLIQADVVITVLGVGAIVAPPVLALAGTLLTATGVMTGTALTPIPGIVGSSYTSKAKAFSSCTFATSPNTLSPFGSLYAGASGTRPNLPSLSVEFNGRMAIAPGAAVGLTMSGTTYATSQPSALCTFVWEEIPIDYISPQ